MPGGKVTTREVALIIENAAGCTIWFNQELKGPVEITYVVRAISGGAPHDRVSTSIASGWQAIPGRPRSPGAAFGPLQRL